MSTGPGVSAVHFINKSSPARTLSPASGFVNEFDAEAMVARRVTAAMIENFIFVSALGTMERQPKNLRIKAVCLSNRERERERRKISATENIK